MFAKQLKTHLFDKNDLSVAEDIRFVLFIINVFDFSLQGHIFDCFICLIKSGYKCIIALCTGS